MPSYPTVHLPGFTNSEYERLLGRALIRPDLEPLRPWFAGMSILVTGAAGSIGAELSSQLLALAPRTLVCVDHDETALFHLEQRLSRSPHTVHYYVDDAGDAPRMRDVLLQHNVDAIFHAAAYKHVPLMERNPGKALKNNVFALASLLRSAQDAGVTRFLLISTDKAVNPVSVMGCTKRIGELLLASRPAQPMRCMSVRFGNVLDSQGSVLPIFREQLRNREPLSVTHPDATRFFLTIPEAASLLLQSFALANSGDTLVLTTGAPIPILRLAETLIQISGSPGTNPPIVFTGLRSGEKLHEELFYEREEQSPTPCEYIVRAHAPAPQSSGLARRLQELEALLASAAAPDLLRAMAKIVPEYRFDVVPPEFSSAIPIASLASPGDEP